ncbi:MAG: aminopeptidase P family protein [Bacteroidia bacterium]|nr:aminopeptidase P family protein [Bacteroidia bacterium]
MFDKQVYTERRNRLREKMGSGIILIPGNTESPMNYPENTYHFRQDSTFLYLFGLDMPGLFGVIDANTGNDMLFGNNNSIEDIIWSGIKPTIKDLAASVGVVNTSPFKEISIKVRQSVSKANPVHFIPPYRAEIKLLLEELTGIQASHLANHASLDLIHALVGMRSIKDEFEIAEIEKACETGYQMHVTAMKMAKPGVMEQEIAGTIEGIALATGGGTSFPTILTQNGQTLHNHDHSFKLEKGRLMIIDAGAESNSHYASDFTRTVPVGGKFSQKQLDIYNIVLEANNSATSLIKPGETYLSIHLKVAEVITSGLKDLGLMKGDIQEAVANGAHALFFPHGLGHMMGLDVHDMENYGQIYVGYDDEIRPVNQFGTAYLRLGRRLQEGFVITNEPGLYFIPALIEKWYNEKINHAFINFDEAKKYLDFGGIRLEDDILVTATGSRILGNRIPINPDEVESLQLK